MQTLYTVTTSAGNPGKPVSHQKMLEQHFSQTRSLLVYLIWFLTEVTRYAETEAHKRASKHLPSADDLNVNTKIAGNTTLWKILEDKGLTEQLHQEKPELRGDKELVRKIYLALAETPEYKKYIAAAGRDAEEDKNIVTFILNDSLLSNPLFIAHIEDLFPNWNDDGDLVVQLMAAYLQKPGSIKFRQMLTPDKDEFAKSLLQTVIEKDQYLHEFIIPKLKNWDPERIALLDMLLMKMGVAEFLYFDTIPPKVTINEYIDLAKEYSTQQSGQFVNGILDNIHKELVQQDKMQKRDHRQA